MTTIPPPCIRVLTSACALVEFTIPLLEAYSGVEPDKVVSYLTEEDAAAFVEQNGPAWRVTDLPSLRGVLRRLTRTLWELESRARQTFALTLVRASQEAGHLGVWAQPQGHSSVFLEYRQGDWHVLHGEAFHDCGHPPVRNLRELQMHIVDSGAD